MLESFSEDLKKIFLFGIGAMAMTAEKSKVLIDELVAKGEITVEQGKVLNEELMHNIKQTIRDSVTDEKPPAPPTVDTVAADLDKLTKEELQVLKEKITSLEAEKTVNEAASSDQENQSQSEDQLADRLR